MKEEALRELRALLAAGGLTRRDAAAALYLSRSALNRKLRGDLGLSPEEAERLRRLAEQRGQHAP